MLSLSEGSLIEFEATVNGDMDGREGGVGGEGKHATAIWKRCYHGAMVVLVVGSLYKID